MNIKSIIFASLFLFLFTPSPSAAEIGTLVINKGIVHIRRGHRDITLRTPYRKTEIHESDIIHTGKNTLVSIRMPSIGHDVNIYSNTVYMVPKNRKKELNSTVPFGKVRFLINRLKLLIRQKVSIKTTTAIIGVKGTDFIIGVRGTETDLVTIEGIVGFANIQKPEIEVEVTANHGSRTVKNQPPQIPIPIKREQVEKLIIGDDVSSFEELPLVDGESSAETGEKKGGEQRDKESKTNSTPIGEEVEEIWEIIKEVGETTEEVIPITEKNITITIEDQEVK